MTIINKNVNLTITGQCPSGKNSVIITMTGKRFPNPRFKKWREIAIKELDKQIKMMYNDYAFPISSFCKVEINYYPKDRKRRDVPGILDALWHVCERANLIKDDFFLGSTLRFENKGLNKDFPKIELVITPDPEFTKNFYNGK